MSRRRPLLRLLPGRALLRGGFASAVALILAVGVVGTATAKGEGITKAQKTELQTALVNYQSEPGIQQVLRKLVESNRKLHSSTYPEVVGPLFVRPDLTKALAPEKRRTLLAAIIAHLVQVQPEDDKAPILLAQAFLPLLGTDTALLDELMEQRFLLDPLGESREHFKRLRERAITGLASSHADERLGAIRVLGRVAPGDAADALAALHDTVLAAAGSMPEATAAAVLDTADRLLGHAFGSTVELRTFLADAKDPVTGKVLLGPADSRNWTLKDRYRLLSGFQAELIRLLKARGGEQESRAHKAAYDYGKALIEKANDPRDLVVFFDPDRVQLQELQRLVLTEAAPRMGPAATDAWAELLRMALLHSADPVVLDRVIAVVGQTFTERTDAAKPLAATVAARLRDGAATDGTELRTNLARILGRIGSLPDVRDALSKRAPDDTEQQDVWSLLIRALGVVEGGRVDQLRQYYRRNGKLRPQWERLAVAQTLGQKAFQPADGDKPNLEAPQAALFLMHILQGTLGRAIALEVEDAEKNKIQLVRLYVGDEVESAQAKADAEAGSIRLEFTADDAGADPDAAVREAAVDSLNFHAGAKTAAVLGRAAADDESAVAVAALRMLGLQVGRSSPDAAGALAGFLQGNPEEKRLLAALEVIRYTKMPAEGSARSKLGSGVVHVLSTKGVSDAVALKAADVATHLQHVPALAPVYAAWKASPAEARSAWQTKLEELIQALAAAAGKDEATDIALERMIDDLVTGDPDNASTVTKILADLKGTETFLLKRRRAAIQYMYTGVQSGRTKDERRAELDAALRLYGELIAASKDKPQQVQSDLRSMLYSVLNKRWSPEWLKGGDAPENPALFQLAALEAAAASGDPTTARLALESEVPALAASKSLDKEQTAQRDRDAERVATLAKAEKAAPKAEPKKEPAKAKASAKADK